MAYDKIDDINSILCSVHMAATGKMSCKSARRFLMGRNIEIVCNLALGGYKKLLNVAPEKSIGCNYILHLLLWVLQYQDRLEMLSKISNENIEKLKNAILFVKEYTCPESGPDKSEAKKLTKEYHTQNQKLSLPPDQRSKNTTARYSDLIRYKVAEIWPDVVAQLDEWLGVIDNYQNGVVVAQEKINEPVSKKTEEAIGVKEMPEIEQISVPENKVDADKSLLSMAELAVELGLPNVKALFNKFQWLKKHGRIIDKDWFVGSGGRKGKFFKVEHLPELKEILKSTKKKGRPSKSNGMSQKVSNKGAGQIIPVEKEDGPVVVETKSPADASVTECPINLVDVKGFEAYLAKLIQMKERAGDTLEEAESEYNELHTRLQTAENKKVDAQKRFDELNALVTEGTSLLNEFTNAEKAFDSSRAKVIDFLNANNTCVK